MAKSSGENQHSGVSRREFLKTTAATAAVTALPGAPVIATGAAAAAPASASLIASPILAKTLGLLYGLWANGIEPDGDPDFPVSKGTSQPTPLADLAKQIVDTILVYDDEKASDEDKKQAKSKLLKQLVETGFRVGKAVKESADAYDGYVDMLRQWQKNPESSNETRALDSIIKLSWSYAQGERNAAQAILDKALKSGKIKENLHYKASPNKDSTDHFWDLSCDDEYSKYLVVNKKTQDKLLAQYQEDFEEAMEPWYDTFTNLAAQVDGKRRKRHHYDDENPLAEGIRENLLNRVRDLQSEPTAADLIDAFLDPRDKWSNISDTISTPVHNYIVDALKKDPKNSALNKFKNEDFDNGLEKIFGAKAEAVIQTEFNKGFNAVIGERKSNMADMPYHGDDRAYMSEAKQRSLDASAMREGFEQEANHWRSKLSAENPTTSWKRGVGSD